MEKRIFDDVTKTRDDLAPEYIYYSVASSLYKLVDFSKYKEINDKGEEVISINKYHKCLLEECNEYKEFVIDEVLYDIDRFGYYATTEIENAIADAVMLLEDDYTPDDFGEDTWNSLGLLSDSHYRKERNKHKKSLRTKKRF